MISLLQPDMPGFGIFSLAGLATIIACWLILSFTHPACLIAARSADFLQNIAFRTSKTKPSEQHGLECSSANALGSGYLQRGEALAPGMALFGLGLLEVFFNATASPLQALSLSSSVAIATLATVALSAMTPLLDNTRMAWNSVVAPTRALLLNTLAFIALGSVLFLSGFSASTTLSAVFLATAARALSLLCIRGYGQFSVGMIFWVPVMLMAFSAMTFVTAIVGPFVFFMNKVVEHPGFANLPFGRTRELQINKAELSLPRCFSLDAVPGMMRPR